MIAPLSLKITRWLCLTAILLSVLHHAGQMWREGIRQEARVIIARYHVMEQRYKTLHPTPPDDDQN